MQVVAAVVGGEQLIGMLGIADYGIEIDHRIEVAVGADPLIHGLAVRFAGWPGVIKTGANVRCDGGAIDQQSVGMGARDDLLIGGEDTPHEGGMVFRRDFRMLGQAAEIVDAFEDNDPSHASRRQHIAIEASEGGWSQAVGQKVVAADTLIGDANVARFMRGLEPCGEHISPTVVAVGGGAVAVGDGVAKDGDGCG